MLTDTVLPDAGASYASSQGSRPKSNSAKSPTKSAKSSAGGVDEAAGQRAAKKLKTADYLLTQLQSIISELKQEGVGVRFFKMADRTQITLANVWVCPTHQILHSGPTCPIG